MCIFYLLIISLLLCPFAGAEATGSVFFIDSSSHRYFRAPSTNDATTSHSVLLPEVGAAVSVLLGFAPSSTLSAAGSSKLNEILISDPFDRPRAVFMLEVTGFDDPLVVDPANTLFQNVLRSNVDLGSSKADIQLQDEDEISVVSLDEPLGDCTDKQIIDFASWLGGSYVADATKPLNGVLTVPLSNGAIVNLHMSKKVDREFASSLLALSHNIKGAMEMHEDLSQSKRSPAELMMGSFDEIKALYEQYGTEGAQQGMGLLLAALSKIFESLQKAYKGQIVGIIVLHGTPSQELKGLLNVIFNSQHSPRWLAETKNSSNTTLGPEVVLVRRTLAWVTGIVLLISTLLGIYFLLNMPLTRDTLLYSNVKLD